MKQMLAIWLLFASLATAAEPVYKLRLYESQAAYLVGNLKVSQLHKVDTPYAEMEVYLLHADTLPKMAQRVKELKSLGLKGVPGLRVFEYNQVADWVKPGHWQKKAAELVSVAKMRAGGDRRVYIDIENYHTGAEAMASVIDPLGGKVALAEAIKPFTDGIRSQAVVPCFTPGSTDDLFIEQCLAASDGRGELLDESVFYADICYRTEHHKMLDFILTAAHRRRAALMKYPKVKWTPGLFAEPLRSYSVRFNDDFRWAFGEPDCWLFLYPRDDETKLGTAKWLDGRTQSLLNDCLYYPLRAPSGAEEWQKRDRLTTTWLTEAGVETLAIPDAPRDSVTDSAYWPQGRRFLKGKAPVVPLTICADVLLTRKESAGLFGVWTNKYGAWGVRYEAASESLVFDWSTTAKAFRDAAKVPLSVGKVHRVCLTIGEGKASISVGNQVASIDCTPRDHSWPLTIGHSEAAGKPLLADALRIREFCVWRRVLTPRELAAVRKGFNFPIWK